MGRTALSAGKTSNQLHSQAGFIFQFSEYVLFRCQSKDPEVHISAQPVTPSSSLDFNEERALTYIHSPAWGGTGASLNIPLCEMHGTLLLFSSPGR